jgi:hypothetical protein
MLASVQHAISIAHVTDICKYLVASFKKRYHVVYGDGVTTIMLNTEGGYLG